MHWAGNGSQPQPDTLFRHLSIDIDDVEDEDILQHFPVCVCFIENGLYPGTFPDVDRIPHGTVLQGRVEDDVVRDGEYDDGIVFAEDSKDEHGNDEAEGGGPAPAVTAKLSRTPADIANPTPPSSDIPPSTTTAANNSLTTTPPAAPAVSEVQPPKPPGVSPGAVFVHCAMGKSRSVSAVIAYLLWKHPERYGGSREVDPATGREQRSFRGVSGMKAVARALSWVRNARPMAEPNDGFMEQLALWWDMGCPVDFVQQGMDGAGATVLETKREYRRWRWDREVERAVGLGRAPERLRFEDEEAARPQTVEPVAMKPQEASAAAGVAKSNGDNVQLRCHKCRRVLATSPFIIAHPTPADPAGYTTPRSQVKPCPHFFVEPLSWMRTALEGSGATSDPTLESLARDGSASAKGRNKRNRASAGGGSGDDAGPLEGRLICPNARCNATVGRFSWKGFRCSCGEWVTPAFSLQRSRVDEDRVSASVPQPSAGAKLPPGGVEGGASPTSAVGGPTTLASGASDAPVTGVHEGQHPHRL